MFAAIRRFSFKPGTVDEVMHSIESEFVPSLAQIPGFVAYHVVDIGENKAISVSVFESKDGAEQSSRLADEVVRGKLSRLGATHLEILTGEVGVHRLAPQPAGARYTK
jgi:hypothetical protein